MIFNKEELMVTLAILRDEAGVEMKGGKGDGGVGRRRWHLRCWRS